MKVMKMYWITFRAFSKLKYCESELLNGNGAGEIVQFMTFFILLDLFAVNNILRVKFQYVVQSRISQRISFKRTVH